MLLIFSVSLNAQSLREVSVGVGVSSFNVDTKSSSNVGLHMKLSVSNFYVDCSLNDTQLKGDYLQVSGLSTSVGTYEAANSVDIGMFNVVNMNTVIAGVVNIGYITPLNARINLIPLVGIGWEHYITSKPYLILQMNKEPFLTSPELKVWSTHYYDNVKRYLNLGIVVNFKVTQHISVYGGAGVFERFKGGVSYSFN